MFRDMILVAAVCNIGFYLLYKELENLGATEIELLLAKMIALAFSSIATIIIIKE